MSVRARHLLYLAGGSSFAVAALHVIMAFSVPLCRFCGAPEWVFAAKLPARLAIVLAVATVFGALGAAVLRPLAHAVQPHTAVLVGIGAVYALRGLAVVPEALIAAGLLRIAHPLAPQMPFFSVVSLLIGLAHLAAAHALRATAPGSSRR
jgi:hypothetical protein